MQSNPNAGRRRITLVTEKLSHRGVSYDNDAAGSAQDNYLSLELTKYNPHGDTSHGNDAILAAFQEGAEPASDDQRIISKAANQWPDKGNRTSSEEYTPAFRNVNDEPVMEPENLLALRYVADIAKPYEGALQQVGRAIAQNSEEGKRRENAFKAGFDRTLADVRAAQGTAVQETVEPVEQVRTMYEGFGMSEAQIAERMEGITNETAEAMLAEFDRRLSADAQAAREASEHRTELVLSFIEQNPTDWERKAKDILEICGDLNEAGKLMVAEGLLSGDLEAIQDGRTAMQIAARGATNLGDEDNEFVVAQRYWEQAVQTEDPFWAAATRGMINDWMRNILRPDEDSGVPALLEARSSHRLETAKAVRAQES